jgi:hypothetical protein
MSRFGVYIVLYAITSMVLWFVNINWMFLAWVDLWGPVVGWLLRISILVAGIGVYRTADD